MNLVIALLLASADRASAQHAQDQQAVVDQMSVDFGVTVSAVWQPCGFENAFYMPEPIGAVVFCMDNQDGFAQTAAHEMAHAVIDQRHLNPGDDPKAQERGADELGALWLLSYGRVDDVTAGAKKYMRWAQEQGPEPLDDDHPKLMDRAWELLCLADGSTPDGSPECQGLYAFKVAYWVGQLRSSM